MEVLLKAEEEEKESKVHFAERNKCHTINYLFPTFTFTVSIALPQHYQHGTQIGVLST